LPNIVFILADDVGYGDLGVYGGRIATPNIDSLALDGVRFTDAHSPAALCAPSRFSLLTGSYPYRNGRPGGSWDINSSSGFTAGAEHLVEGRHVTVGEILQRAGYTTGFIGKLHLGGDVFDAAGQVIREKRRLNEMDFSRGVQDGINAHGFDYSFALQSGIQHEPYAFFENGRYWPIDPSAAADNSSTTLYQNGLYSVGNNGVSEIVEAGEIPARGDIAYDSSQVGPLLTRKAIDFIDDSLRRNEREGRARPFALYFSSQAIHVPHTPPADFNGDPELLDQAVGGTTGGATSDMLRELDLQVGALLDKLDAEGVLDDTLIFLTSDNGALWPHATEHGDPGHDSNGLFRDYKASIYEGGHRVPFIARWGDGTVEGSRIPPGSSVDHTIVNHDWVATVYELTGQPMPEDQAMDSVSLLPLLLGRNDDPVHEFVLYQAGFAQRGAIREGGYVLLIDEFNEATELYDLESDPGQTRDLIATEEHRALVEHLRTRFVLHNDHDDHTFDEPRTTPAYTPAAREE
jgi:arylsulfatase A-like enzyme